MTIYIAKDKQGRRVKIQDDAPNLEDPEALGRVVKTALDYFVKKSYNVLELVIPLEISQPGNNTEPYYIDRPNDNQDQTVPDTKKK